MFFRDGFHWVDRLTWVNPARVSGSVTSHTAHRMWMWRAKRELRKPSASVCANVFTSFVRNSRQISEMCLLFTSLCCCLAQQKATLRQVLSGSSEQLGAAQIWSHGICTMALPKCSFVCRKCPTAASYRPDSRKPSTCSGFVKCCSCVDDVLVFEFVTGLPQMVSPELLCFSRPCLAPRVNEIQDTLLI